MGGSGTKVKQVHSAAVTPSTYGDSQSPSVLCPVGCIDMLWSQYEVCYSVGAGGSDHYIVTGLFGSHSSRKITNTKNLIIND